MNNLPATLQDRVRERIEAGIADLITPEEIDRLVHAGIHEFMVNKLRPAVQEAIAAKFKEAITTALQAPEYADIWKPNGERGASEMVKKMMAENSATILASLVEGIVGSAIYQLRQQLSQRQY